MTPRRSDAADRILREATRLFAEKGYERTSVPEIQAAAGLTRGSGAMYKHYPSKEALLRAVVNLSFVKAREARSTMQDGALPAGDALCRMARHTIEILGRSRADLRILWRELEQFPSLQTKVRRDVMQTTYKSLAAWLHDRTRKGELRHHDSEAVAAVILGGLVMFKVFETLWGEKTIAVDDERFVAAWCDLVPRGLGVSAPDIAKPSVSRKRVGGRATKARRTARARGDADRPAKGR